MKKQGLRSTGDDPTGRETMRDEKGWEYSVGKDGPTQMTPDSAQIRKEQADTIQRETRGGVRGVKALDESTRMGNPARYAKGGAVKGWGKARGARAAKIV